MTLLPSSSPHCTVRQATSGCFVRRTKLKRHRGRPALRNCPASAAPKPAPPSSTWGASRSHSSTGRVSNADDAIGESYRIPRSGGLACAQAHGTAHARAADAAVPVRILREVLLVVVLGEVELGR